MKSTELITDKELNEVFKGTNFGDRTPREIVNKSLKDISDGYATGHTALCCLVELGLVDQKTPKDYKINSMGRKYLKFVDDDMERELFKNEETELVELFHLVRKLYREKSDQYKNYHIYETYNDSYDDFTYTEYSVYMRNGISFAISGEENYNQLDTTSTIVFIFGGKHRVKKITDYINENK